MSKACFSEIVYSIYLATAGAVLAFIPNLLLPLVGLQMSNEAFIRLCGSLALVLGAKAMFYARLEIVSMYEADVYARTFVGTLLLVPVLMKRAPPIFLILSAIDYGSALWTQIAIWSDRRMRAQAARV